MLPVHLCLAAHDQQGAVAQGEFDRRQFLAVFVFEQEAAGASQAQRGDSRLFAQFAFVVTVPTHAVLAVAVMIEQDTVKVYLDIFFEASFELPQRRGPGVRFKRQARISIARVRISMPGR